MNTRVPNILILPLLLGLAILSKCTQQGTQTTPPSAIQQPSPTPSPDTFPLAVKNAIAASQLTQTAKTDTQWQEIIHNWEQAIAQMQTVPSTSPKHPTAQQKIPEYQRNLDYATQQHQALRKPRIQRGEQLAKNLKGITQVAGQLTPVPVVRIILLKTEWDKLSTTDQINITFYAESIIPIIRSQPEKYTKISPQAPAYQTIINKTTNLCDDCWEIITGRKAPNNSIFIDETEVQGDTPYKNSDSCCKGSKSSNFRQPEKTPPKEGT